MMRDASLLEKGRIGVRVHEILTVRLPRRDRLRLLAGGRREVTLQRFAGLRLMTGQSQRRDKVCTETRINDDRPGGPVQSPDRAPGAPRIARRGR